MPYGDREKQLEFLRDYYAEYRIENAEQIAEKSARWFRENQDHAQARRRRNRALERARTALRAGGVPVEFHGLIESAVGIGAEYPDTPGEVLVKLLRPLPDREWRKFLAGLGWRDRARLEEVRA
jgi:hypothetical protein